MSGFCTLFAVSCQPRHQGGTLGSLTDPFLLQDSESRSSFRPFPTDSHRPVLNRVHCRTTPVAQLLRTGRSPPVALHGHITAPQLLSVTNGRTPVGWGLPPHHVDAFTGALEHLALRGVVPRSAAQRGARTLLRANRARGRPLNAGLFCRCARKSTDNQGMHCSEETQHRRH